MVRRIATVLPRLPLQSLRANDIATVSIERDGQRMTIEGDVVMVNGLPAVDGDYLRPETDEILFVSRATYLESQGHLLPMRRGSVLYPHDPVEYGIFVVDEEGAWWAVGAQHPTPGWKVLDRLVEGTHYVLFSGIEG